MPSVALRYRLRSRPRHLVGIDKLALKRIDTYENADDHPILC